MKFYENLEEVMENFIKSGGFLTVKWGDKVNTMTVSWGFIGFLWAKPHCIVLVRPQRYTMELIQNADNFTLSIPLGNKKEELGICGTKSGREIDKSQVVDFVPAKAVESPVVAGCGSYFECVIRYREKFREELLPDYVREQMYNDDYHSVFIGEIVECYSNR